MCDRKNKHNVNQNFNATIKFGAYISYFEKKEKL